MIFIMTQPMLRLLKALSARLVPHTSS